MLIIYGLGNNEEKYLKTKHNIGRRVIEALVVKQNVTFSKNKSYYYTKSKQFLPNEITYLYSAGYMNESGQPLVDFCKYTSFVSGEAHSPQLLIIQDDSDQIEGKIKLSAQGGSAGHHGITSIYRELAATPISLNNVWRLKIGIRPEANRLRSETFVLSRLSSNDESTITKTATKLEDSLGFMVNGEWSKAQTLLNS